MAETLRIEQVKSSNGANPAQRDTLRTLGLHGIGTATVRQDGPAVRGMVRAVSHLVAVDDQAAETPAKEEPTDG
jgi:large subunit ribosomal protein L30